MKKLMIALAFVGFAMNAAAQGTTEVPVHKHKVVTNTFGANWFIQAGANFNASYTSQENCGNKNPFATISYKKRLASVKSGTCNRKISKS